MFIYLFHIDWRMGFASLITMSVGIIASSFMFIKMSERFQNDIEKTKILNYRAVEYIQRKIRKGRKRRFGLLCRMDEGLHLALYNCLCNCPFHPSIRYLIILVFLGKIGFRNFSNLEKNNKIIRRVSSRQISFRQNHVI